MKETFSMFYFLVSKLLILCFSSNICMYLLLDTYYNNTYLCTILKKYLFNFNIIILNMSKSAEDFKSKPSTY